MKFTQVQRLLLAVAAAAAAAGLMLKLTDVSEEPRVASAPAPEPPRAVPATPTSPATPAGTGAASEPAPAAPTPRVDAAAPSAPPAPIAGMEGNSRVVSLVPPQPGATPVGERRRLRNPRGKKGKKGGGVEVGGVEATAAGRLGDSPAAGVQGPSTASGAGTEKPQKAQNQEEAPPLPPDVAYASTDTQLFSTSSVVEVPELPNIAGRSGTVSLWLQPQWQDGNQDDAALVQLGQDLQLIKNVNFLRFETTPDGGTNGVGVPISDWKEGEWHQVAATWNGGTLTLYVDGQLVSSTQREIPVELAPDTKLTIGSPFPPNRPIAPAVIGRLDLRTRTMDATEIARAYERAVTAESTRKQ